jgi:CheY-like chemotaxis protein/HPt (histidine-containing phosphotransfer) domain-containing protein
MGGSISVDSQPGAGASFRFTVVLERSTADPAVSPRRPTSIQRVLVVDDHPVNRRILRAQLESFGLAVETAGTAEEGLALVETAASRGRTFDLAILDYQLPGHDGVWLGEQIRGRDSTGECRLLLLGSLARRPNLDAAPIFDRAMAKPVRRDALLRTIVELGDGGTKAIAESPSPRPLHGRRVLLAEDNPVNETLAVRILAGLGVESVVARTGREAIEHLQKDAFDAVLMDCQMPVMDGYTASRAIRSGDSGCLDPAIPIIAMTAHALAGDREVCLAAGMSDYLTKPIDPSRLRDALLRAMSSNPRSDVPIPVPVDAQPLQSEALDLAALLAATDNDELFVASLLQLFFDSGQPLVDQIVLTADPAERRRAAHQLKGAALNVKARQIAAMADGIERGAGSGSELAAAWSDVAAAVYSALDLLRRGKDDTRVTASRS